MLKENPIKIGTLVYHADPYKAPEQNYGYGIVMEIVNSNYVVVHWFWYNYLQATDISNLEVINE
tara:strand:- start:410 stop:601 length:192 start_codon:yes stop_codon:yes gene_type:complete